VVDVLEQFQTRIRAHQETIIKMQNANFATKPMDEAELERSIQ